jgi:YbgC/YbaW family acyl-CoA thioester hydrolase
MAAFEATVTIRFEDADPAGIVFYPRAIALAHGVVEDLIRHTELGWHGWFDHHGWAAPVRHAAADFLAPMRAGETLGARASVEKFGGTSATFLVEFTDAGGALRARVRTVHVLVDRATGKPVSIPADIREALAPFSA